ncbi:hypothetical protein ACIQUM_07720 [Amycolatopsis azurea]|uniref:hypothetical protein n=1 Tax=Amycolatopsis azurea TaxID=36819 RepID=UPI003803AE6A
MTQPNREPTDSLPKFTANVIPTSRLSGDDLGAVLRRYRSGETKPVIFGDDNVPEAAVIPFAAFIRLMKSDHASYIGEEGAFQSEAARRVRASDTARESGDPGTGMTLEQLAENLGEPARSIMLRQLSDG